MTNQLHQNKPHWRPLILASQSPRRRQLLTQAGYQFEVIPADPSVERSIERDQAPSQFVASAALAKARSIAAAVANGVILSADTIAVCKNDILGKPHDRDDARRMLRQLQGERHSVFTAVCLWNRPGDQHICQVFETVLRMDARNDQEIEAYLQTNQWRGKAGAFGYQDGWDWLHVIEGSGSNVVGLPIEELPRLFATLKETIARSDLGTE